MNLGGRHSEVERTTRVAVHGALGTDGSGSTELHQLCDSLLERPGVARRRSKRLDGAQVFAMSRLEAPIRVGLASLAWLVSFHGLILCADYRPVLGRLIA